MMVWCQSCQWAISKFLQAPYQNEVKCSAFDVQMIFHSHANKTHFCKKGCPLGLILKVRVFGIRQWPTAFDTGVASSTEDVDLHEWVVLV